MREESFALKGEDYLGGWLKLEKLLVLESLFVRKLKNQFIWNKQQKKVSFNYAASVNIKYFYSVLPQFEQMREVCMLDMLCMCA